MPGTNRINTYLSEIAYSQPCLDYLYENLTANMKMDVNGSVTGLARGGGAQTQESRTHLQDKIVLDHITYAYPNTEKNIFTDAHMEVKKGQSVGIMGPSGAGNRRLWIFCWGFCGCRRGRSPATG